MGTRGTQIAASDKPSLEQSLQAKTTEVLTINISCCRLPGFMTTCYDRELSPPTLISISLQRIPSPSSSACTSLYPASLASVAISLNGHVTQARPVRSNLGAFSELLWKRGLCFPLGLHRWWDVNGSSPEHLVSTKEVTFWRMEPLQAGELALLPQRKRIKIASPGFSCICQFHDRNIHHRQFHTKGFSNTAHKIPGCHTVGLNTILEWKPISLKTEPRDGKRWKRYPG